MILTFVDLLLVVIAVYGVYGSYRGVRATALTTGAIFFALVVVLFSSVLVIQAADRIGVPLTTPDSQALFQAGLFLFTSLMASLVLGRIVNVPPKAQSRPERLWGLALGLLNGFFVMAIVSRYASNAIQASTHGSSASFEVPALVFSHPTPNTWSMTLQPSALTILPPTSSGDLWSRLPIALVLLLLFLAFVFVGTVYGRVSGSRR